MTYSICIYLAVPAPSAREALQKVTYSRDVANLPKAWGAQVEYGTLDAEEGISLEELEGEV